MSTFGKSYLKDKWKDPFGSLLVPGSQWWGRWTVHVWEKLDWNRPACMSKSDSPKWGSPTSLGLGAGQTISLPKT